MDFRQNQVTPFLYAFLLNYGFSTNADSFHDNYLAKKICKNLKYYYYIDFSEISK